MDRRVGGPGRAASRAPIVLRPSGGAASAAAQFQIQAGAFSQEEPARELLERLDGVGPGDGRRRLLRRPRRLSRAARRRSRRASEAEALQAPPEGAGPGVRSSCRALRGRRGVPASIVVTGGRIARSSCRRPSTCSPPAPDVRVALDGVTYRGSLRVAVNPRGDAQRRQPRRPRGVPLRRRARRDGAEAVRRARGAEGAGGRRADVRAGAPRPVRVRGLRPVRDAQVPGLRAALPPRTRSRPPRSTRRAGSCSPGRASSRTPCSSRPAAARRRTSRTSSPAAPCPTSSSVECGELAHLRADRRGPSERGRLPAEVAPRVARLRPAAPRRAGRGSPRGRARDRAGLGGRAAPRLASRPA